jgi:hypothetical protein
MNRYDIQLRGQVDEADLNRMSPLQMAHQPGDAGLIAAHREMCHGRIVGLTRHLQRAWLYLHLHNLNL